MRGIYGMQPSTPQERSVLGCLWMVLLVALIGVSLYVCVRTGFRDTRGTTPLAVGVALAGLTAAVHHAWRRWAG